MKRVFLLAIIICAAYSVRGNDAFAQGDWVIGAAVAIGEHYASDANNSKTPVVALLGEYCVVGDSYGGLGVGLKVGYSSYATNVGQNASVDVGNAFFWEELTGITNFYPV
ncbi:MAG: hypothetical protein LBH34_04720 [Prevotellaceae bacterium]|jgi:outer membrane scaffolding protein for murein synthesis (MipA/OmpV family)|nr:hypothetical protein [Prevotellaceae bacterium]